MKRLGVKKAKYDPDFRPTGEDAINGFYDIGVEHADRHTSGEVRSDTKCGGGMLMLRSLSNRMAELERKLENQYATKQDLSQVRSERHAAALPTPRRTAGRRPPVKELLTSPPQDELPICQMLGMLDSMVELFDLFRRVVGITYLDAAERRGFDSKELMKELRQELRLTRLHLVKLRTSMLDQVADVGDAMLAAEETGR